MGFKSTNVAATTAAVTDRFLNSVDMKVGAYTLDQTAPVWAGGCYVTVTVTTVDTADTLGTITLVGKDLHGITISESITPIAGQAVSSTKIYRSLTSATGVGWVIDAVEGSEDTIVIGCAADSYAAIGGGMVHSVIVNNSVAATIVLSDSAGTLITVPASQAAGTEYLLDLPYSGYLKIATTNTNNVTVVHTPGVPTSYAMA